jgi:hypothetical protein
MPTDGGAKSKDSAEHGQQEEADDSLAYLKFRSVPNTWFTLVTLSHSKTPSTTKKRYLIGLKS